MLNIDIFIPVRLGSERLPKKALKKINSDFDHGAIPRGEYEDLIREYSQNLTQTQNKIHSKFNGLEDLVN